MHLFSLVPLSELKKSNLNAIHQSSPILPWAEILTFVPRDQLRTQLLNTLNNIFFKNKRCEK